jgi:signal transduction histidine kinase
MTGTTMTPPARHPLAGLWPGIRGRLLACVRGLAFCGLMLAGAVLLLVLALALTEIARLGNTGGVSRSVPLLALAAALVPASLLTMRWLAGVTRTLTARWCGVPIDVPYRPAPAAAQGPLRHRLGRRAWWLLADPATWRDLLWMVADAGGGWVLAAAPAALLIGGLVTGAAGAVKLTGFGYHDSGGRSWALLLLGLSIVAVGLWAAPRLLAGYGVMARSMLGPTRSAGLLLRVDHLAQTRSESLDTGAAEMRRIERDLHDGAQARLVATGMALDAAEQLLDTSPAAARALLAEARESSARALAELRDLVRGIHPPVLADRGLTEAIRAVALDLPMRVQFRTELDGRAPAPVESAAYFAVSELLANVSKHAGARQAWIDVRYAAGMLRISVSDDGTGGADPAAGTGLRGIERRLAAFDGVLGVSSPPGGPTVANIEIPCVLSSAAAAAQPRGGRATMPHG